MRKKIVFAVILIAQLVLLYALRESQVKTIEGGRKILLEVLPGEPVVDKNIFYGDYINLQYRFSSIHLPEGKRFKKGERLYAILKKKQRFWDLESIHKGEPLLQTGEHDKTVIAGRVTSKNTVKVISLGNYRNVSRDGWLKNNPGLLPPVKKIERNFSLWRPGDTVYIPIDSKAFIGNLDQYIDEDLQKLKKDLPPDNPNIIIVSAQVLSVEEQHINIAVEYGIENYYIPEEKREFIASALRSSRVFAEVAVDEEGHSAISDIYVNDQPLSLLF